MAIFLHGLSLRRYRGIGANAQNAAPFKECNFFIGANNTGKSIFLNFISLHLNKLLTGARTGLDLAPWEVHVGGNKSQIEVGFGMPVKLLSEISTSLLAQIPNSSLSKSTLTKLIDQLSSDDCVWIDIDPANVSVKSFRERDRAASSLSNDELYQLWMTLNRNSSGGARETHWVPQILNWIMTTVPFSLPKAYLIPALRRIEDSGQPGDDYSGRGLISRLAQLQNPGPEDRALYIQFQKINDFLKEVTSDLDVQIEVPFDRRELLVHKDGRVLPLSSLGTGVHEVIMIAAFCTLIENSIVCVEEPEVHLHPLLQKKLLKYLTSRTTNQYFIATHSASIIDQVGAAVFHVTHQDTTTKIEIASTPAQRLRVCQDLGYRASDLLQTNFIIWVEGPTDRIYLNHWISDVDPELQEGIHYSIMFYGGRLLSHLSADDTEISDFIALRRLNQNVAIVIDSDKKNSRAPINDTKKRIVAEFERTGHVAWVTSGREIENYLHSDTLDNVLRKLYPAFESVIGADRFDHRLEFVQQGKKKDRVFIADKLKVARAVCNHPADLSILNLRTKVELIVSKIRSANH